jgi:hypothetical protein
MTAAAIHVNANALGAPAGRQQRPTGTDWAGLWFDILDEAGEFVGMRAGRRVAGAEEPAWTFDSHAAYDGLGWFATLLRKDARRGEITIPRMKETNRPSLLAQARAFLELLARKPETAAMWNTWDAGWLAPAGGSSAGNAVAVQLFDPAPTRELIDLANSQGVSLNSLLLAALGRASERRLQGGRALWMVPVNMRGPVNLADETANHTSYLQICTGADLTAQHVHDQVKGKLARNEHWGGWLFANVGRVVRYAGMKWLFRREIERTGGRPWVGAFSNLGTWEDCGHWFVCPPVAKTCPLGVGVVICEGSLTLTIEAHSSIGVDAGWARALMDCWIAELGA